LIARFRLQRDIEELDSCKYHTLISMLIGLLEDRQHSLF
jgi:hypothetical protein